MPPDLIARLEILGGRLLSTEPSRFGSYEVLTPYGATDKQMWCTPHALRALCDEWDGTTHGPRIGCMFCLERP